MRFTKMHGAGNDYVYVDCFAEPMPDDPAALAREIADRHYGVGGDGLILICPSQRADARMRMYNADGSESEMCGNGIRCVAKYVVDHGLASGPSLTIETGAGILTVDTESADGLVQRVRVDMGEPILEPARVPAALPGFTADRIVDVDARPYIALDETAEWISASGLDVRMTCLSMGNPHVVFYCRDVRPIPLESVGPLVEHLPIFPRRINVHFVQVHSSSEATMRTWERGSGVTLACGTGASAVCVAGVLTGRTSRQLLAHLPGGDLQLDWAKNNHVYMTGPAVEVFSGEWNASGKLSSAARVP